MEEASTMLHKSWGKLVTVESFAPIRKRLRNEGRSLVWTNGCFDLLHPGHVLYLQEAKSLGDVLLVAVNSDRSFRQWKKRPGPVQSEKDRVTLLCALRMVDYVILFDAPSPLELLRRIKPDIYVKGTDYTLETIDQEERRAVEESGGAIRFCKGLEGRSTTALIENILKLYSSKSGAEYGRNPSA